MTTITLPPDLENQLAQEAKQRGTTPEVLALDGLRLLFAPTPAETPNGHGTLFDFLGSYVGAVAGTPEPLSQDCGRRFAQGLEDRRKERP